MQLTRPLLTSFTYSLGSSLYIPLTSRCNTVTLPETRGPNFVLPPQVVAALCRVRDAEKKEDAWKHWCMWLETQDASQSMPAPLERVACLEEKDLSTRRPTVAELLEEVDAHLQSSDDKLTSIAIAGEGEPTLRWKACLDLIRQVRQRTTCNVRLVTNGLLPFETTVGTADELLQAGLTHVSVALMTHDSQQYQDLMLPTFSDSKRNGAHHEAVQEWIRQAVEADLSVEATAVSREDVDQQATNALAASLGVTAPVRWRPYFP